MHILLIHQLFIRPQDPGGTRHFELARRLVESGHQITVLAGTRSYLTGAKTDAPQREELISGLRIVRCGVLGGRHSSFVWRTIGFISFLLSSLRAGLGIRGVDAVWGTSPPLFQAISAWALARLKRIPWLFEVRDLWPAFAVQAGVLRNPVLIRLAQAAERFLYRHADRIAVNSPGFTDHLLQAGAEPAKVSLIPNGVDTAAFVNSPQGRELRAAHGLQGKFVALYAGAHGLANDLGVILQAAARLRGDPRIAFLMVGDGAEKAALQRQSAAMALTNLSFLPPVQKASMPELLAAADCGIAVLKPIPLFATTYPNKVFDYMAASLPVVLGIAGPIRDVVEGSRAGVAFAPGDAEGLAQALSGLADDPEQARQMGERGRSCVKQRFDWRPIAAELEALLRELASPPGMD